MYYNPDIYGWTQMSPKIQNHVRKTVFSNIRQKFIIYFNNIPVETFDEECSDERFMRKVVQLDVLFGRPAEVHALLSVMQRTEGIRNPYVAVYTVEWGVGKPAKFVEVNNLMYLMYPGTIMMKPTDYNFTRYLLTLRLGETQDNRYFTAQRTLQNKYIIDWKFSLNTSTVFTTRRQDLEVVQDAFQTTEYAGLERFGDRFVESIFSAMAARKVNVLYDVLGLDYEIHMLPMPSALELNLGGPAASKSSGGSKKNKNKKGGKKSVFSSNRPSAKRVGFVQQQKPRVFLKRAQEMLDMLGYGKQSDYHMVCPKRTHGDVRGSYTSALACNGSQSLEEMRRRRDQGIACGLLRQRASYRHGNGLPSADSHQLPLGLSYHHSTECSKKICASNGVEDRNRDLASWLQLKGPYLKS